MTADAASPTRFGMSSVKTPSPMKNCSNAPSSQAVRMTFEPPST
jgi:hypothetical protein